MRKLLKVLIGSSEKAANIARIIRKENDLFQLLIEEKTEKNQRFVQDFKTLADVLIQESLKYDISSIFPQLSENIFGEESNTFKNKVGESITIKIEDDEESTKQLLFTVLNGNRNAAELLAKEVHRTIEIDDEEILDFSKENEFDSIDKLGIWIDPIDATNEYIKEISDDNDVENYDEKIWKKGIHCVTVLIGVFHMETGDPLLGVLNQPFWMFDKNSQAWKGRYFWGLSNGHTNFKRIKNESFPEKLRVIISNSEDEELKKKLSNNFEVICSSGAGYKLLAVALGLVDIYILTKSSVHFWDCCSAHALLKAFGGNVLYFQDVFKDSKTSAALSASSKKDYDIKQLEKYSLKYSISEEDKINNFIVHGGLIAFAESNNLQVPLSLIENCINN